VPTPGARRKARESSASGITSMWKDARLESEGAPTDQERKEPQTGAGDVAHESTGTWRHRPKNPPIF